MPAPSHRAPDTNDLGVARHKDGVVAAECDGPRQSAAARVQHGDTQSIRIESRLLESLTEKERHAVLAAASRRFFRRNEVIIHAGDSAQSLYLLVSGQARYFVISEAGQQISFQWLTPGDIFGGATLLPAASIYLASTEMIRPGRVLVWQRRVIRQLASQCPRLVENALTIASDYFAWFIAAHMALACDSARQRLARVVTTLSRGIGQQQADGTILLEVTNDQLAMASNLTKFTVCRILGDWRAAGALAKRRGKIVVYRPDLFV